LSLTQVFTHCWWSLDDFPVDAAIAAWLRLKERRGREWCRGTADQHALISACLRWARVVPCDLMLATRRVKLKVIGMGTSATSTSTSELSVPHISGQNGPPEGSTKLW